MSDGGLDSFWNSLRRAEHRFEAEAKETERELYRTIYGYKSRVMRLRSALAKSGPIAFQTVTAKLQGIKMDAIWSILFAAVRDMALYYGGSVVLGTAVGAGLGSLVFGAGAIPGAAIGAEAGSVVGEWVLMYLGLKMLAEGLVNTIPPALRLYVQGFRLAWGPAESDRPDARYSADYHHGEDMAAHRFADGHVLMIMAILMAMVAYLTRGKSEEALMQAVRKSERLGAKMADWLEENKERLLKEESLKPKVVERAPSQVKEVPRVSQRPRIPVRSNRVPGSTVVEGNAAPKSVATDLDALRAKYADEINSVSTFKTNGLSTADADQFLASSNGQKLLDALSSADPSASADTIYSRAMGMVQSGSNLPEVQTMTSPLVKIVPQGQTVSPYSPYFTTMEDLNNASSSGMSLADYFGLPVKSEAPVYDIYQMSPAAGAEPTVFVSQVAPTSELGGLVERAGGASQYIVPNRGTWTTPTLVGTIGN